MILAEVEIIGLTKLSAGGEDKTDLLHVQGCSKNGSNVALRVDLETGRHLFIGQKITVLAVKGHKKE